MLDNLTLDTNLKMSILTLHQTWHTIDHKTLTSKVPMYLSVSFIFWSISHIILHNLLQKLLYPFDNGKTTPLQLPAVT